MVQKPKALHCPRCTGLFFPVSASRTMLVQCPHCSSSVIVGDCTGADVEMPDGYDYHPISEAQEAAARREVSHHRNLRSLLILLGIGMVLGIALWMWQRYSAMDFTLIDDVKIADLSASDVARQSEDRETEQLVRRVLGAGSWIGMLPDVADARRVESVMKWYFEQIPGGYIPLDVVETNERERIVAEGVDMMRVRFSTAKDPVLWCLLVKEAGRWKFDWEAFTNPGRARWQAFLDEPAGTTVELRLYVARMPGADAMIIKAGASPETHSAIKLWSTDELHRAVAILAKKSPIWAQLEGIGWDSAAKIIAQTTMLQPQADPPVVILERITRHGWLWRQDKKPVEHKRSQ